MRHPADDERLTVMGLLAETWAGLTALTAAQLAEHGLGDMEFEVLLRLARSPEGRLRMTDLAAQTSLTSSGITRVVDRLVQAGSLSREACTTDRRTTYAVLSDAGRERLGAALPGHIELLERWVVGPLTPEALASFVECLRVLRDGVRPCAEAGAGGTAGTARRAAVLADGSELRETAAPATLG
ncbi:MAG: MarR family transcriptional regulator, and catechol-resistance regulon repressor [Actinomycetota bacterium]|nr:MarR family transcriptional regulator, and catechol-resistance regulon repressor [Actinomycetota bacterium]MDQ1665015.1 MarR family transcriptional regulator, and catechol-resistance regulon repressor [Actinomycetota bacterium]